MDNPDFSLMAPDLDKIVYLSGAEWHGTKASYDIQYALATSLNKHAGVNYLLIGYGHATAEMYNAYLESGDIETLNSIHYHMRFTSSSNNEHRLFWQKLYEYNKTLPMEDKFTVIGIDLEFLPNLAIHYLTTLPGADKLSLIIPEAPLRNPNAISQYVKTLQQDVVANEELYKDSLGDWYSEFDLVLNNMADTVAAHLVDNYYEVREDFMYNYFLRAYDKYPNGKFFGQLTMEHIYQDQAWTPLLDYSDKLATHLNKADSPVHGQVLSIASIYMDSTYRFYWGRFHDAEIRDYILSNQAPFDLLAETDFTLFRLTGEDSPFNDRNYIVKKSNGGVTTDFFQYLLVIKNSRPTSPNQT